MKLSTSTPDLAMLVRLLKPHRSKISLLGLTSLLAGVLEALFLFLIARVALSISGDEETIHIFYGLDLSIAETLVVAGIVIAVRMVATLISILISTSLARTVAITTRERLAAAYLSSSWSLQQSEPAGTLQQLLMSFTFSVTGLVNVAGVAVTASLTLLALLVTAALVNLVATLLVIAALLLFAVVLSPLRHRLKTRSEVLASEQLSLATKVSELDSLGLEIQSFALPQQVLEHLRPLIKSETLARQRVDNLVQASVPVYITFAYTAVVIGLAGVAVLDISDFGSTSVVMLIMLRSLIYGQQVQQATTALAETSPFLRFVEETHLRYEASRPKRGAVVVKTLESVQLDKLWFSYREGIPALSGLSLNIQAGEIIGIVGPSGSGKSTLVEILLGIRSPDEGMVLVNGIDLSELSRESWSAISAFVPQETTLITGTVSENIRFFRQGITDEEVVRAARHAFIDGDVRKLAAGYESWIGERGDELSGGQRQRLAIARAIVGNPQLLILDEPTSALDDRSEGMIRKTLTDLSRSRTTTVVVVAHRMSTLSVCDRILVLQDGRMIVFDKTRRVLDPELGYSAVLEASDID